MSSCSCSGCTAQQPEDELIQWHDSTNVFLNYLEGHDFLECGSNTDRVQLSSLKEMNDTLLASTHISIDERLAMAKKYSNQARYLENKLQILFHRQNGTEHSAYTASYALLHGQGYGTRTDAAELAALNDPYLVTIHPGTFAITRRFLTW